MLDANKRPIYSHHRLLLLYLPLVVLAVAVVCIPFMVPQSAHANQQTAVTTVPGVWTPVSNTPDYGAQLVLLHDARVMDTNLNANPITANIYDPATDTWTTTASLGQQVHGASAVLLGDGQVFYAGGVDVCGTTPCITAASFLYDPNSDTWATTTPMSTKRLAASATVLRNGKVLVVGGYNQDVSFGEQYLASAELYDPTTRQWSSAGNMTYSRAGQWSVLLKDGRVLVLGGESAPTIGSTGKGYSGCGVQCPQFVATPEIYDPATNRWSTAAPIPNAYQQFTVTVLPTGKVLLAGAYEGATSTGAYSTNLLYDPVANSWSTAAAMITPRIGQVVVLLPTGNVLVEGGETATVGFIQSAEEYNPFTNAWTATASVGTNRAHTDGTAVVLADGRVMVNGGTFYGPGCCTPPRRFVAGIGWTSPKSSGPSPYVDIFSTVPGLVSNVHATASDGSATVTWAPALSDGSAITGYTITSRPGNVSKSVNRSATSVAVGGLTNGTSYTFTVTASNGFGAGPTSATSNSVVPTGASTGDGGTGPTANTATPTPTSTADTSSTPIAQVSQPQQQPATVSKPAPPPSSQFPIGLVIGLIVLLALIVGGGAAFLISRSRQSGTP